MQPPQRRPAARAARAARAATAALCLVLLLAAEQRRSFVQAAPAPQESSGSGEAPKDFDEVKQLEELKNSLGKTFSLLKTHSAMFSDVNGQREGHSETREEVSRDGQLVARLQQRVDSAQEEAAATPATRVLTEVDIPERGVHKTLLQILSQKLCDADVRVRYWRQEFTSETPQQRDYAARGNLEHPPAQQPQQPQAQAPPQAQPQQPAAPQPGQEAALAQPQSPPPPPPPADITDNGERRAAPDTNSLAKYLPYSGVQYSPLDMAEYVFWTGDERGVTLAIEEFLQEGLMTREEAINFLQEIKYNLDFLQTHYAQQRLHKQEQIQAKERATLIQKALGLDKPRAEPKMSTEITHEGLFTKKSIPDIQATPKDITMMNNNRLQQQNLGLSDEDYEELLERLRVADFLYTEYSLEEVIYQLAKVMFAQSLNRGNADAQEALQKFTNFLESEAEQGHISRSLEKKVLDVLIASLADTLSEHPHLVNAAREGLGSSGGNKLLHQLLLLNPAAVVGEGAGAGGTGNNQDFTSGNDSHQSTLAKARQMVDANGGSTNKSNKAT